MHKLNNAVVSLMLVSASLLVPALSATESNRVIMRVNDHIVTLYDYEMRRNERLRAIQAADLDPARRADLIEGLGAEVLGNMLNELLVLSRADQIGYVPTPNEIEAAMDRAKQNFGLESDEQFEQALQQSSMTMDQFRQQVESNLRVSQVMGREVQQRVELDEEDMRRYYHQNPQRFTTPERVRLQEFVVLDTAPLTAAGRAELAAQLREEIEAGGSMTDLAAKYSGEGSTSGVVELGWIEKGDLDATLEQAVWNLAPGSVSAPIEARGGLHLVEVLEREEASLRPFQDVAGEIDRIERGRLLDEEYGSYLNELRETAYIRLSNLPADAQNFSVQDSGHRMTLESDLSQALADPQLIDDSEESTSDEPVGESAPDPGL